ncbi:MAG: tetratricopeptide repeat protein [Bacteroidia bacterium]
MRYLIIVLILFLNFGNILSQSLLLKVKNLDVSKNQYSCIILRKNLRKAQTILDKVNASNALADHFSNETEVAYNTDSILFYRKLIIKILESENHIDDEKLSYELLKAKRTLKSFEFEEVGDYFETDRKIRYLEKRDANTNNDLKKLSGVYNSLGNLLMGRDSALIYYQMSLALAERIKHHQMIAYAAENITHEVVFKAERQVYFNKAIDAYIALNDFSSLAYLLSHIGASYLDEQEDDSAKIFFDLSIKYYRELGFKWQEALHFSNQGWAYREAGKLDESIVLLNKSLDLAIEIHDSNLIANIYNELAISNKISADYPSALRHYFKAMPLFKKMKNDRMYAGVLHNIGEIYRVISRHKLAVKHFELALAENIRLGNYEWQNYNYRNLAYEYMSQEMYAVALEKAKEASKTTRINDLNELFSDTVLIGRCYQKLGNYQLAYLSFKSAEKMVNDKVASGIISHKMRIKSSVIHHRLGALFFELFDKNYKAEIIGPNNAKVDATSYLSLANKYIELAIESDENEEGLHNSKAKRFALYSKILFATGTYAKAYIMQNKAQALKDSIFNDEKTREIASVEFKYKAITDSIAEVQKTKDAEIELEKLEKRRIRKNKIQYSFVIIIVLLLAGAISALTKFRVGPKWASGLIFIFFILLFEFLLVILDPWVDSVSHGEVGYKIAINTLIAVILFGIHHISEKRLKSVLINAHN